MDVLAAQWPRFVAATWLTLWLFVVTTGLSTVIGAAAALLADATGRIVAVPLAIYGWVFRGLPELLVLLACYLALPQLGFDPGAIGAAILGFTLVGVAFQIEIFRGGLAAIDPRMLEAARALGMGRTTALRRLILPQLLRTVLPAWATFSAGNVKALAVASAISVSEIMAVTRQSLAISHQPFTLILMAAGLYAMIASALMLVDVVARRRFAAFLQH